MTPAPREWEIISILLALVQWRIPSGGGGHGAMPLPWGTAGQGMSLGAPAGDPSLPRKDHSKRAHFGFKRSLFDNQRPLAPGANSIPRRPFYKKKRVISIFCGTFSASGPFELQGDPEPLALPVTSSGCALRTESTGTEQGEMGRIVSFLPKSPFLLRILPTQNV